MRRAALALIALAVGCDRGEPPPPRAVPAPSADAARPEQVLHEAPRTFELTRELSSLVPAAAPSASRPLGTVLVALDGAEAELVEWDLSRGAVVGSRSWPDPVPLGAATLGVATSGRGVFTVTSGDDGFESATRISRLPREPGNRTWSASMPPGMHAAIACDARTCVVSQQRPGRVILQAFDADDGKKLGERTFASAAMVLPRLRPIADVVVAHGSVYVALPHRGVRVLRLERTLAPTRSGDFVLTRSESDEQLGLTPRLTATDSGVLVADVARDVVLALGADLGEQRRWSAPLDEDDAVVAVGDGFATASGLTDAGRVFSWQVPSAWKPSDKGYFERRAIANVHGRVVVARSCCGRTALITRD